ncbi:MULTISPECIES: maleylpyruvate isomerase family mycothiol-dependent enzyme [Streptomyces]|uniref:maleylpyruvate isomerase family mycothiol-dependent enzyme n=1 Tax=Streptomyces TaxID=1883 RepID=UPI00069AC0EC|nr:maleylpyruvate isomerase family mycothiol-dependent enzyme [Streptomyces sp. SID7805]MYU55824.1 maleylpyruvate isomerase family mycothiol-dependent enzyme [Streptomyces sp. SID7805]
MDITEHLERLRLDGTLLADAADAAGPDARVPACPEWQVRDLVSHIGRVHHGAAQFLTDRAERPGRFPEAPELADSELIPWLREGHRLLVATLTAAPPDLTVWTFLPAPSPLAFWARRQAHETAVHRVDAQQAAGMALSPLPAAFAADGIDELLAGFHSLDRSSVRTDVPRTLRVRATDVADADWTVHLSTEPPRTVRTAGTAESGAAPQEPADSTVEGPAEELYLALWNRLPWDGLTVTGDPAPVRLWQEKAGI